MPGWHMLCSTVELLRPGDFITDELFGIPIIVRNFDGQIFAFRNVCSHRNCLINSQRVGHLEKFKCQYHGWEYKSDGTTSHIPEGNCFRPLDRAKAKLQTFPISICGDLVFVSLSDDPPALRDFIGERFEQIAARFSSPSRYTVTRHHIFPCNWKIALENTLEGYHINEVHPKSFMGIYPGESHSSHSLEKRSTRLEYDLREYPSISRFLRIGAKILGAEISNSYTHYHIHPGFVLITLDLQAYAFAYEPTSERTSKLRMVAYSYRGRRNNPLALVSWWISRFLGKRMVQQIILEDAALFEDIQRGVDASHQVGCIGTMEERLFTFQRYILDNCASQGQKTQIAKDKDKKG